MADAVDKFKKAVEQVDHEGHHQKLMTFGSTGRHFMISYPQDMRDDELLDLLGYFTHEFRQQLPPVTGLGPLTGRVAHG